MSKIEIRGEWMELPDARLYVEKLKNGIIPIELTDGEREKYNLFKKTFHEELGEKEYLITNLESLIAIEEHFVRIKNN